MFPKHMCLTLFFIALNMYVHCTYITVGRFGGLQIVAILPKKHCLENHVCPSAIAREKYCFFNARSFKSFWWNTKKGRS